MVMGGRSHSPTVGRLGVWEQSPYRRSLPELSELMSLVDAHEHGSSNVFSIYDSGGPQQTRLGPAAHAGIPAWFVDPCVAPVPGRRLGRQCSQACGR